MRYSRERNKERIMAIFAFFRQVIVKIFSLAFLTVLIITIFIAVFFFRDVVLGDSTVSDFKNNHYGIPVKELAEINSQIAANLSQAKEWLKNLKERLDS